MLPIEPLFVGMSLFVGILNFARLWDSSTISLLRSIALDTVRLLSVDGGPIDPLDGSGISRRGIFTLLALIALVISRGVIGGTAIVSSLGVMLGTICRFSLFIIFEIVCFRS